MVKQALILLGRICFGSRAAPISPAGAADVGIGPKAAAIWKEGLAAASCQERPFAGGDGIAARGRADLIAEGRPTTSGTPTGVMIISASCKVPHQGALGKKFRTPVREPRREEFIPKAYWIATYRSIKDPEALAEYAKLAGPAIWAAGGRNLVRGTPAKTLEAGMDLRTVVIEFDSVASAIAAYDSPAYQAARKLLGDTVVRDIRIVEGTE